MANITAKMFVLYKNTKATFVEKVINAGLADLYKNKIVFIGEEGKGECIYAQGRFFENKQSMKYFSGITDGKSSAQAAGPEGVIAFNSGNDEITVAIGSNGVTIGLSDEFLTAFEAKAEAANLIKVEQDYKAADSKLAERVLAVEQAVGTEGGSVDTQIGIKIASELGKLNYESGEGQYVASVKQTNGKVEVTMGNFNFATPTDVTNAKNAVIGDPTNDTAESVTIYGSRKYAAAQASSAQAAAINAAASDATSKANAAEAAAKGHADAEIAKLNADVNGESADGLVKVQVTESAGKLTGVVVTTNDIAKASDLADVKADVDAFFKDANLTAEAKDTLKEIQEYIDSDVQAAATMTSSIQDAKNAAAAAQGAADKAQGEVDALELVVAGVKATADAAATQANLEAEARTARAAEQALGGRLDTIEGEAEGSIKKAVADAKSDLTTLINGKVSLGDFDSAIEDLGDADATNLAAAKKHADDAIAALDVEDAAVAGQYVSAVSEVDGKISVTRAALPVDVLETGDANGQVKFNGTNVDVKGLGSAAYENVNAFAVKGTETVASDAKTLAEANEDAIEAMQLGEVSGYIKSVSQLNGKVSASAVSAIPSADVTVVSEKGLVSTTVAKALDELADMWAWQEVSE